jgi:predicted metal-dependent HD superfamily phosphohydrolase
MKCPLCSVEMRITKTRNILENDNTPDAETKLYVEQDLSCLNKNCSNYEKVVKTVRSEIPIG